MIKESTLNKMIWFSSLFLLFIIISLIGDINKLNKPYTHPVYISSNMSILRLVSNNYNVTGALKNMTNDTITISELTLYMSGINEYSIDTLENIIIAANDTYIINLDYYIGGTNPRGYIDVRITNCIIEEKSFVPLFSKDGINFNNNYYNSIIGLSVGVLVFGLIDAIAIYKKYH